MSKTRVCNRLLSAVFVTALLSACAPQSSTAAAAASRPVAEPQIPSGPPPAPLVRGLPDFTDLVAAVGPAVVHVRVVEQASSARTGSSPFGGDQDQLSEFFRRFGIPRESIPSVPRNSPPRTGQGSGFFVTSDGYMLTNAHVVSTASKITVTLTDRREFAAKVIGIDEATDVAVLKVDGKNLPTVRLGNPNRVRAGEWVVAIGSPFGFENSVTAGIISATARSVPNGSQSNYVNFIQSDVAVNPGNSGGPLFNLSGEVIGINSQIISNTGSFAGLSFAIPIDIANNVREQLVKNGRVSRGRIGVQIQPVTAELAESYGLDRPRGALVTSVVSGGPADKAGIKPEDIILSVNGQIVENSTEVPPVIAAIRPGTSAQLEVWRERGSKRLNAVVEELPETGQLARAQRGGGGGDGGAASTVDKLGLSVRELTPQEKQQLGTSGTVVVEQASGAAAEANIQSGDVILRANGARVNTVEELRGAVRGGGLARLMIQRGEGQIIVTVRPD